MARLHHILLGTQPDIFLCHGILGSGQNWRSFARLLRQKYPKLGIALIDLRNHGKSEKGQSPHSIQSCAQDLINLAQEIGTPKIIIGHSFGGKVVLEYARREKPLQAWILDSPPGTLAEKPADKSEVLHVIEALEKVPLPLEKRKDLVDFLMMQGCSRAVAQWMTTNLRHSDEGYAFRFSLPIIRELIFDYFRYDGWPILEAGQQDIHIVRAQNSDRWSPIAISRLANLRSECVHILPRAAHWVHVDNPQGLCTLLMRYFPTFS